jgi:hypothetical protein
MTFRIDRDRFLRETSDVSPAVEKARRELIDAIALAHGGYHCRYRVREIANGTGEFATGEQMTLPSLREWRDTVLQLNGGLK